MIWQYFEALRRLVSQLDADQDEALLKQNVALSIFLSVTVVEAFVNIFFRIVVSENNFIRHKQRVMNDLYHHKSLDYKLKHWPKAILGKGLNFNEPVPKAFLDLKNRRNVLMHFTSTHESLKLLGIEVHGLADTATFDTLQVSDAAEALDLAEGMLCELFRLKGATEQHLKHALHAWTGKVPI
jgi:hypothetical protein